MRRKIPNWKGWTISHPCDDGSDLPYHVKERAKEVRELVHKKKKEVNQIVRKGVFSDMPIASYSFGPFDLPIDVFTSSRWSERRTQIPLPTDMESWRFCWEWWKGSNSYLGIKKHIEKYGMRRCLVAEWFVNYDPETSRLLHRCFAFTGNLDWPFLILRTGNERIMMAWFEWGWKTVPTCIIVRDCGYSQMFSKILKWGAYKANKIGLLRSRGINRSFKEKYKSFNA